MKGREEAAFILASLSQQHPQAPPCFIHHCIAQGNRYAVIREKRELNKVNLFIYPRTVQRQSKPNKLNNFSFQKAMSSTGDLFIYPRWLTVLQRLPSI
jgi:hypothetical protein